jgi:hypothetical protein
MLGVDRSLVVAGVDNYLIVVGVDVTWLWFEFI